MDAGWMDAGWMQGWMQVTGRASPKAAGFGQVGAVKSPLEACLRFLGGLGEHHSTGDLPLWRHVLLLCCVGTWVIFGSRHFWKEIEIYPSTPHTQVANTKQVYPVPVNHGYLRYMTKEEAEAWEFSNSTTGPIFIGAAALAMRL